MHKLDVWCENYRIPFIQKTRTTSNKKRGKEKTGSWSPSTRQSEMELWGWLLLISVSDEICILALREKNVEEDKQIEGRREVMCVTWGNRMMKRRNIAWKEEVSRLKNSFYMALVEWDLVEKHYQSHSTTSEIYYKA